ncbi:MAG: selenocysteine-specific translation elongation factor [Coriobacteriia bacterium]|nr:selenocysteine-specific translation elongation factor [Coriobacteriia bacterium]
MNAPAPDLVLGTAGHIDHGKSSLVLALTGTDPDRLAEEKKRGITIELGFAQLKLPNGRAMGVVDVPGHERFVRQMIAGSTGIDVALLVIAADDGIMPQTIEHVAVLQTLGVPRCVVALTKTDLVDEEWLAFMKDEVRAWLAETPYADAAIIPVSNRTGEGVEDVRAAIQEACAGANHLRAGSQLRMPVDRVFTIKGAGTVVTGTLWSGTASPGQNVEVLPQGRTSRIRSVQMHGSDVQAAPAGNRVALNLPDLAKDDLHPGDFLAEPGTLAPSDRFDARLTYLDTIGRGKPFPTGTRVHIAHGTREVLGRVLLADGQDHLKPGESCYAQIRLEEPLPLSTGDRFIMRTYSPVSVAGGGMVLQAHPRRRTNLQAGEQEQLNALEHGDLQTAIEALVRQQAAPTTAEETARSIGIEEAVALQCLDSAARARRLVEVGSGAQRLFSTQALVQRTVSAIDRTLIGFHAQNPKAVGMGRAELAQACAPKMDASRFGALVDEAVRAGKAVSVGNLVGHPSAMGAAQAAKDQEADQLLAEMLRVGVTPPPLKYLFEQAGLGQNEGRQALTALVRSGRAQRITEELFLAASTLAGCEEAIRAHLNAGGEGTVAALKDAMGTTRKFAVPLLEYFDAHGVTKRDGDTRTLA